MTANQIGDDLLTHLIPSTIVVPAMVTVVTLLQSKYGYAYITVA